MIGATYHTITRASGSWERETGNWRPNKERVFAVLGTLEQIDSLTVIMDPVHTNTRSRWRLILADGEPELMVGSEDQRVGDRLQHGGKLLTVVSAGEAPEVGALPRCSYELVEPGRDAAEVHP